MQCPFPGMDPYLEQRGVWKTLHNALLTDISRTLQPLLRPRYWVAVEELTYEAVPDDLVLLGGPDVSVVDLRPPPGGATAGGVALLPRVEQVGIPLPETIREKYLEIRDPQTGEVITVIEVLSPTNKRTGAHYDQYLRKRATILGSHTNLVEIDLLRQGQRMPMRRAPGAVPYDYSILICRPRLSDRADFYPLSVRDPLPEVPIPLRIGEPDVPLPIGAVFAAAYDRGGFDLIVDYRLPPRPPLSEADAEWADVVLRQAGLR